MFKKIIDIIGNRAKVGLVEYIMQICISALHEYQRSSQSGEFDLNRQAQESRQNEVKDLDTLPSINRNKNLFDWLQNK